MQQDGDEDADESDDGTSSRVPEHAQHEGRRAGRLTPEILSEHVKVGDRGRPNGLLQKAGGGQQVFA